jgi:hypothetical protein
MDILIFILSEDLDIYKKNESFYAVDCAKNNIFEINKLVNTRNGALIKDIDTFHTTCQDWFASPRRMHEFHKIFHIQCILDVDNANVIRQEDIEYDTVSNNFLLKKDIVLNYIYYEDNLYFINTYHAKGSFLFSNCFPIIHVPFKKIIQSSLQRLPLPQDKLYYFDILQTDCDEFTMDPQFMLQNISTFFRKFYKISCSLPYVENTPHDQTTHPHSNETDSTCPETLTHTPRPKLLYGQPKVPFKKRSNHRLLLDTESKIAHKPHDWNAPDSTIEYLAPESPTLPSQTMVLRKTAASPSIAGDDFCGKSLFRPRRVSMSKAPPATSELVRMHDTHSHSSIKTSLHNNREKISEILRKNFPTNSVKKYTLPSDTHYLCETDTTILRNIAESPVQSPDDARRESAASTTHPKIVLVTVGWNEATMLPMFLKYYAPQVDRIVYFDNQSTDCSREILQNYSGDSPAHTCEIVVKEFDTHNEINDDMLLDLKNSEWKKHQRDFDWAIVVDVDEFVVPLTASQSLREFLGTQSEYGAVQAVGYQMFGNECVFLNITRGAKYEQYDKVCCWNLHRLIEINYYHGSHRCSPQFASANTHIHKRACQLRHMKFVGNLDDLCRRVAEYQKRLCSKNKKNNWGNQYSISFFKKSYLHFSRKAADVC